MTILKLTAFPKTKETPRHLQLQRGTKIIGLILAGGQIEVNGSTDFTLPEWKQVTAIVENFDLFHENLIRLKVLENEVERLTAYLNDEERTRL